MHRRLVCIYLLNVPSFSSRYFNKIKRTSRSGRLLALSLEILNIAEEAKTNRFTLIVPWLCDSFAHGAIDLQPAIVVFPEHTHLQFCKENRLLLHQGKFGFETLGKCFVLAPWLHLMFVLALTICESRALQFV